jgi:SPP1 gp7 family putative phage head morphogenesis protein
MADVIKVRPKKLPAEVAAAVAGKGTIQGNRVLDWWRTQNNQLQAGFARSVRQSMTHGETLQQAVTRVVGGTVDGVKVKGIMAVSRAQASALVATSMNHATNQARLATYRKNTDVVKAIQQVSTLDNRTSEVCIAYSGLVWDAETLEPIDHDLPFNGGPPRHFNCRSTLVPITKSFRELGVNIDEVPKGERASMDGAVPEDTTFDQFLRGKTEDFQNELLGEEKAALWRDNRITLQQLVDFRGNPVPVAELKTLLASDSPAAANVQAPSLEAPYNDLWLDDVLQVANEGGTARVSNAQYTASQEAYIKAHEPAFDALPAAIRESVEAYKGSMYRYINADLRGEPVRENMRLRASADAANIERALAQAKPLEADTLVFRGMQVTPKAFANLRPGDVVETRGFTSVTGAARTALDFSADLDKVDSSNATIIEMVLPKGSKVLAGFNRSEVEYLLDHRTDMQVVSVRMEHDNNLNRDIRIIRMVYLGQ